MSILKTVARNSVAGAMSLSGLTSLLRRASRQKFAVLCYHRVLPEDLRRQYPFPELVVTPETLEAHVEFCQKHYECLPLREVAQRASAGRFGSKALLAFTFDDGYWDNFAYARPILQSQGVRATFFVITSLVDSGAPAWFDRLARAVLQVQESGASVPEPVSENTETAAWIKANLFGGDGRTVSRVVAEAKTLDEKARMAVVRGIDALAYGDQPADGSRDRIMNRDELIQLAAEGHEVGSHTRSHPILTKVTPDRCAEELQASRDDLAGMLGTDVDSFCYPNGDYDAGIASAVLHAGYRWAVTIDSGLNAGSADPMRLKRFFVSQRRLSRADGKFSATLFALALTGFTNKLRAFQDLT